MRITEMFHSIQGEGQTIGKNVVFLRFSGCNQHCWFCDSKNTWDKDQFFEKEISIDEVIKYYRETKAQGLVLTGGETLLRQKDIIGLLLAYDFKHVEIETNGTIQFDYELRNLVDYWNVSPKLESSGNAKKTRYNKESLVSLSYENSIFKFVIASEEDLDEVEYIIDDLKLDKWQIYLMTEGTTREKQIKTQQKVIDICLERGYNYSPRTHILIWDSKKLV